MDEPQADHLQPLRQLPRGGRPTTSSTAVSSIRPCPRPTGSTRSVRRALDVHHNTHQGKVGVPRWLPGRDWASRTRRSDPLRGRDQPVRRRLTLEVDPAAYRWTLLRPPEKGSSIRHLHRGWLGRGVCREVPRPLPGLARVRLPACPAGDAARVQPPGHGPTGDRRAARTVPAGPPSQTRHRPRAVAQPRPPARPAPHRMPRHPASRGGRPSTVTRRSTSGSSARSGRPRDRSLACGRPARDDNHDPARVALPHLAPSTRSSSGCTWRKMARGAAVALVFLGLLVVFHPARVGHPTGDHPGHGSRPAGPEDSLQHLLDSKGCATSTRTITSSRSSREEFNKKITDLPSAGPRRHPRCQAVASGIFQTLTILILTPLLPRLPPKMKQSACHGPGQPAPARGLVVRGDHAPHRLLRHRQVSIATINAIAS